jgi:predicted transcriptional regulator
MANKFVVKTTEEFTYDEQGRVVKKITTEESYEVEKATITTEDFIKKAVGVPNNPNISGVGVVNTPWKTTVTYDTLNKDFHNTMDAYNKSEAEVGKLMRENFNLQSENYDLQSKLNAKADTSGITHNNITVNANEKVLNAEEVAKTVKKAIEKHQNY